VRRSETLTDVTSSHTGLELIACPACHGNLELRSTEARCRCGLRYDFQGGVPMLHVGRSELARRQADWFDEHADAEWEIERPRGAPALHRWLLEEKFRRAVEGVKLRGATVLTVCAGSGMDAEFLAHAGARVIALDVSLGAARRATERARRHGFELLAVVGDAARLPFRDASVDVVFVHDGLHHLDDPLVGLAEMARVARSAVCVSEPARALITAVAIRGGLALEREEAGNRVGRLDAQAVEAELRRKGFRIAESQRYGMYYRHEPGRLVRLLSHRGLFTASTVSFRLANAVAGRFGNKLAVVAVRS
jgi:SAM-dependent methyltransferase